ncbi:MAG: VPLPA-CTERM sorting domain-containing protein [Pseudomonadota bacterium]
MTSFIEAAAFAAGTFLASAAIASPIPAIDGNYEGFYDIENAFTSHGLWLPGFLGDNTWSITKGSAEFTDGTLSMTGMAENRGYSLNFDFLVFEKPDHSGGLICGGGSECATATDAMKDNIVFFDMGTEAIMGAVTGVEGTALDGLSMDITMRPLPDKPGQLGFGGNWKTLDFGYSNWMSWEVTNAAVGVKTGLSGSGDVNFDFLSNEITNPLPPVPLPAGLPLMLTLIAGGAAMRRLQKKA